MDSEKAPRTEAAARARIGSSAKSEKAIAYSTVRLAPSQASPFCPAHEIER
jgi:hypothetical protein